MSCRFLIVLIICSPFMALLSLAFAEDTKKGRKVALLVAVQDYSGTGLSSLKYCENDVTELAEVLKTQGYKNDDITILTKSAAFEKKQMNLFPKADNIRNWLKGLVEVLQPEDTVLIAFSGHGVHLKQLKDKGLHFCPLEVNLEKHETLVSLAEIYDQLEKNCKSDVKLLLVDACRNDPSDGKGSPDGRIESKTIPLIPDPPGGTVAFFSCSTGEKSYESDAFKHGIFFHYVIQGFKGGHNEKPIAEDGVITIPLLENYLMKVVPLAVKKDSGDPTIKQIPERKGSTRGTVVLSHIHNDYLQLPGGIEFINGYNKLYGVGGTVDAIYGIELLNSATDKKNPFAMATLAIEYRRGLHLNSDDDKCNVLVARALPQLTLFSEANNDIAQYLLGHLLFYGVGTQQDYNKAVILLKKSADQNNPASLTLIAFAYQYGLGATKDIARAFDTMKRAANLKYPEACQALGVMYRDGEGTTQDYIQAVKWFQVGADLGDAYAQGSLATMYLTGRGVDVDYTQAKKYFAISAENNYVGAQYNLGLMYLQGKGGDKDPLKAVKWFKKAADRDMPDAQCQLGLMLVMGTGIDKDDSEALKLFQKAAKRNHARAYFYLGNMYSEGRGGINKDDDEAVRYYRKSAELGDKAAVERLIKLGKNP